MPSAKGFRRRGDDGPSDEPVAIGDVLDGLLSEQVFARGMPCRDPRGVVAFGGGERLASETAPSALEGAS